EKGPGPRLLPCDSTLSSKKRELLSRFGESAMLTGLVRSGFDALDAAVTPFYARVSWHTPWDHRLRRQRIPRRVLRIWYMHRSRSRLWVSRRRQSVRAA